MAHRGWKRDGFTPVKKAEARVEALSAHGIGVRAAQAAGQPAESGQ